MGGIARVGVIDTVDSGATTGGTIVLTNTSAQVAGNLLVLAIGSGGASNFTISGNITDTVGNTYVLAHGPDDNAGPERSWIYYVKNCKAAAAGANTVTVNLTVGNAPNRYGFWRQYSGADVSAPLVGANATIGTTGTAISTSATPTAPADLVVGIIFPDNGGEAKGASFTLGADLTTTAIIYEDKLVSRVTASQTADGTGTSGPWTAQIALFQAASGGIPPQRLRPNLFPGFPFPSIVPLGQGPWIAPAPSAGSVATSYGIETGEYFGGFATVPPITLSGIPSTETSGAPVALMLSFGSSRGPEERSGSGPSALAASSSVPSGETVPSGTLALLASAQGLPSDERAQSGVSIPFATAVGAGIPTNELVPSGTAIALAQAFGIDTTERGGSPSLLLLSIGASPGSDERPGALSTTPLSSAGVASAEVVPSGTFLILSFAQGAPSGEIVPSGVNSLGVSVATAAGIPSGEVFGAFTVLGLASASIASPEQSGASATSPQATAQGLPTSEIFGSIVAALQASGAIPPGEYSGAPSVLPKSSAHGSPSGEAVPSGTAGALATVNPAGIPSAEVVPSGSALALSSGSIQSAESIGPAALLALLSSAGIQSLESVGSGASTPTTFAFAVGAGIESVSIVGAGALRIILRPPIAVLIATSPRVTVLAPSSPCVTWLAPTRPTYAILPPSKQP